VAQEADRTDHQRRLDDLEFALEQAASSMRATSGLAAQGFISAVALEESATSSRSRSACWTGTAQRAAEERCAYALHQMEGDRRPAGRPAAGECDRRRAGRARPGAGVLTDFRMLVGETVRPDQNVGRIDDPSRFKLVAQVDEFYLSRVTVGRPAGDPGRRKALSAAVATVYPQIKDGRFTAEMVFTDAASP
jgi:HlyD family secretion protein